MIFLSANLWDVDYRRATYAWRTDPHREKKPDPREAFLLQLNVTRGVEKVFTMVRVLPGVTAEFSADKARGKIGDSFFEGFMEGEVKKYVVRINSPDLTNSLKLEAEVSFLAVSPGFKVDGLGIFGRIPGGSLQRWEWPIGYPRTNGWVRITDREGKVVFEQSFSEGGGYVDHMWGEGLMGDILDSWYFGRLDLLDRGALIYVWLTPRSQEVSSYGRVFRIPRGELAKVYEIKGFFGANRKTNIYGLEYFSDLIFTLSGGGEVHSRFGDLAVENWPFQVAGEAVISVDIPGDCKVDNQLGLGEYLWQPGIDSEAYKSMFDLLKEFPWNP